MRVKLRQDMLGPHPGYDYTKPLHENAVPFQIIKPAGTVLDGANTYVFMRNGEATPADEEAHAWWDKHVAAKAARELALSEIRKVQLALADAGDDDSDSDSEGDDE